MRRQRSTNYFGTSVSNFRYGDCLTRMVLEVRQRQLNCRLVAPIDRPIQRRLADHVRSSGLGIGTATGRIRARSVRRSLRDLYVTLLRCWRLITGSQLDAAGAAGSASDIGSILVQMSSQVASVA
jgi:hypothetical protein